MKWLALLYLISHDASAHQLTTVEVNTRQDCIRVASEHLKTIDNFSKRQGWHNQYATARCVPVSK